MPQDKLSCEGGSLSGTDWCWCHQAKSAWTTCSLGTCQAPDILQAVTKKGGVCAMCFNHWMANLDTRFMPCDGAGCQMARQLEMEAIQRRAALRAMVEMPPQQQHQMPLPPANLPPGWTAHQDRGGAGAWFYYHAATNTTQWHRPIAVQVAPMKAPPPQLAIDNQASGAAAPSQVAPLPMGWTQHQDSDGHEYYYHGATSTSQWERPTAQAATLPMPLAATTPMVAPKPAPPVGGTATLPVPLAATTHMVAPKPAPPVGGTGSTMPLPAFAAGTTHMVAPKPAPPVGGTATLPVPLAVAPTPAPPMGGTATLPVPMAATTHMVAPKHSTMPLPAFAAGTRGTSSQSSQTDLPPPTKAAPSWLVAPATKAPPTQPPPTQPPATKAPPMQLAIDDQAAGVIQCRWREHQRDLVLRLRGNMSKQDWEARLGDGRWVGSAQSAGPPNTGALARQQAANAQPAAAADTPATTATTTYWPMTQHELEFVEQWKRRMQEETQRRQNQQSLRQSMLVFQHMLEKHEVQNMRLPNPLPDTWQMATPGSASTLPVPRRHPHSPLGSRFRTL